MSKNYNSANIEHVKNGNVEYLQFKILNKYSDKLKHCITLRHGGVSSGDCASLNFRQYGLDSKENVERNLDLICDVIQIPSSNVFKGKQAHTDNILCINNENKEIYAFESMCQNEYDAYICNEKNIATLVTTADCVPVIIYDPQKNVVANIHSGWKGTLKQIAKKTAMCMNEKYDCNYNDMIVCIGPSINKCCFTSKEKNFKDMFLEVYRNEKEYIYYDTTQSGKFHIDIPYVIKKDMESLGVENENIVLSNICTRCNFGDFFSYRFSTQNNMKDYGTFATITCIV